MLLTFPKIAEAALFSAAPFQIILSSAAFATVCRMRMCTLSWDPCLQWCKVTSLHKMLNVGALLESKTYTELSHTYKHTQDCQRVRIMPTSLITFTGAFVARDAEATSSQVPRTFTWLLARFSQRHNATLNGLRNVDDIALHGVSGGGGDVNARHGQ